MGRKAVSGIMLTLLLIGMLTLAFNIQQADAFEPPATEWTRTYGGTGYEGASSVIQTSDGGYALAGSTDSFGGAGGTDCWLVKINASGDVQWNRTYGGTGNDGFYSVVQTSDGGYAMASRGFAQLVKTDENGYLLWHKTYGVDLLSCVVEASDGGYALAGYDQKSGVTDYRDFCLVKTNSSGAMQWMKTYSGAHADGYDVANSVVQTSDGGYALAGGTGPHIYYDDFWLLKTDSSGNAVWNQTYGGTGFEIAECVIQTSDGGYALTGYTESFGHEDDFYLVKTDSTGNIQWTQMYGDDMRVDWPYSVVQTSDGGYILAGYRIDISSDECFVVRTNSTGHMLWNNIYGGAGAEKAYSVIQTSDRGYAIAGYTSSFGAGNRDMWLIKLIYEEIHDIALTNVCVCCSASIVHGGYTSRVNVTVANEGTFPETFNVTTYWNTTAIQTIQFTLPSGASNSTCFSWDTTGLTEYNFYNITAYAHPVQGETDLADNTFNYGLIQIVHEGDVNNDGKVRVDDIFAIALAFGTNCGGPPNTMGYYYDPNLDVNCDDKIRIDDVLAAATNFGWPP